MSLIGALSLLFAFGYSLDNISLLGITLAVGLVVDDAIVMLENIVRHIENGEEPFAASIRGAREIGFTIISMTLSLIAVFIPVLFMSGVVGRLLNEFAVTICAAILVSGFVSLTLTPMLCSRYLKHAAPENHGRVFMAFERFFDAMLGAYRGSLTWCMARPKWVMLSFVLTLIVTALLFGAVSKDFLPSGDTGQIIVSTEGPQDISFPAMMQKQRAVAEILARDPSVRTIGSFLGASGSRPTYNTGTLVLNLKPQDERKEKPAEIIARLRPKVAAVPGVRVFMQNPPPIRIGGQVTSAQFQYTLQDTDLAELYRWNDTLLDRLRQLPGFVDVNTNLKNQSPVIALGIDREKLAPLGLSIGQIEDALQSAFSSRQISTIYAATSQHQVILEVAPEFQADPATLSKIHVRSSNGKLIPVDTVARISRGTQALTVNHQGQLPSVTLSFNLLPGVSLGDAVDRIRKMEREMNMPASLTTSLQGAAQAFEASLQGLGVLLLIAILVVYIVLGILYESFIHLSGRLEGAGGEPDDVGVPPMGIRGEEGFH